MPGAEGAWKGTSKPEHRVEGGVGGSGTAGGNEGRGWGAPLPGPASAWPVSGRPDLAAPGGRNNVRQVPAELRERPSPVSLSALSQVQKSNLLVTPLAPLGNF